MKITITNPGDKPAVEINTVKVDAYAGIIRVLVDCRDKRVENSCSSTHFGDKQVSYDITFFGKNDTFTVVTLEPEDVWESDLVNRSHAVSVGSKHGAFYYIVPKFPDAEDHPAVREIGHYQRED